MAHICGGRTYVLDETRVLQTPRESVAEALAHRSVAVLAFGAQELALLVGGDIGLDLFGGRIGRRCQQLAEHRLVGIVDVEGRQVVWARR